MALPCRGRTPLRLELKLRGTHLHRCSVTARLRVFNSAVDEAPLKWTGQDEFSALGDRSADAPLPLPALSSPARVVLVRHGQSTWNAAGRMQGSSDLSILTAKGEVQAQATCTTLAAVGFSKLYRSPLKRASRTAEIVWGERTGPVEDLPSLREVDLYSLQGLIKDEGLARFGHQYRRWQKSPNDFEMDGHFPVRELWYRGALCWRQILAEPSDGMVLVVAHNAINQGLLGTALGLPPSFFRCFVQSNAAFTVVDFQPNGAAPPRASLERMNHSPESPFKVGDGRKAAVRLVLVMASEEERLSPLGRVQVRKTAELLMDAKISTIVCADAPCARDTAEEIGMLQELAGHARPRLHGLETIEDAPQGTAGGTHAHLKAVCGQGDTLVVVGDASMVASVLADSTHMGEQGMGSFRIDACSISVLEFPDGVECRAVVKCTNYTAHFGRFAAPLAALVDR